MYMLQRDQSLFTMKTQTKALYLEKLFTDRPSIDILYYPEERDDKGTVFGELFTDRPGIDILYYPEERDDKTNESWALRVT